MITGGALRRLDGELEPSRFFVAMLPFRLERQEWSVFAVIVCIYVRIFLHLAYNLPFNGARVS
jgi:hypothetical protein